MWNPAAVTTPTTAQPQSMPQQGGGVAQQQQQPQQPMIATPLMAPAALQQMHQQPHYVVATTPQVQQSSAGPVTYLNVADSGTSDIQHLLAQQQLALLQQQQQQLLVQLQQQRQQQQHREQQVQLQQLQQQQQQLLMQPQMFMANANGQFVLAQAEQPHQMQQPIGAQAILQLPGHQQPQQPQVYYVNHSQLQPQQQQHQLFASSGGVGVALSPQQQPPLSGFTPFQALPRKPSVSGPGCSGSSLPEPTVPTTGHSADWGSNRTVTSEQIPTTTSTPLVQQPEVSSFSLKVSLPKGIPPPELPNGVAKPVYEVEEE